MTGDAAKAVLERANLPNETLGRIWNLSDTEQRGALSLTDFIIAMHLLTTMRSGSLRALPDRLPPALHEAAAAAARRPPAPAARAIPPQFTGQFPAPGAQRPQSPLAGPPRFATSPVTTQTTGSDWLVTAQDKVRFDQEFTRLDTRRVGFIDGEQAVGFFGRSGLSEDTLASIWDLADIRSEGQLNKDEFAVAMYLIRQQRSKTTGRDDLPSALPPQLVPPSMRQKMIPPSQTTAPAFDNSANAPRQQSKSAADDLFGLDAFSNDAPAQASPKQIPTSPTPPTQASPVQAQQTGFGTFTPFQPTSSFGRSLGQSSVGGGSQTNLAQSREMQPQQPSTDDDLLGGDVEPDASSKLGNDTAELGNMSNQLGTLRTQMSEVQTKRSVAENDISTTANQKRELETRLTQFRGQYEQEIREVKALEERLKTSRAETQQLQSQIAMIEGAHTDLKTKHKEVATALDSDQRENAALKERTQVLNAEIAQLKPQLEKMQVDARQHKGLVAINKKQLAASEAERQRIETEMAEAEQERSRLQQEAEASKEALRQDALRQEASRQEAVRQESIRQEASRQESLRQESLRQEASRQASPAVSPPMSSGSNTNPFFRRTTSGSIDRTMSPSIFAASTGENKGHDAFDSFFGPSEDNTQPTQPPPSTSFRSATPIHQLNSPATEAGSRSITPFETSPHSSEPPAPSQANQITSSALPLRMMKSDDSISSSVRPNPPLSRSGGSSRDMQAQATDTSMESLGGEAERSGPNPSAELPRSALDSFPDPPISSPTDKDLTPTSTQAPESVKTESVRSSQPPTDTVPGAFPGDSSAGTTPTTEHSERASTELTAAARGAEPSRAPTSAFSPFAAHIPSASNSRSEFPPIQDLDEDDDSDTSASEGGYDDHHTDSSTAAATRDVTGATSMSGAATSATSTLPLDSTTDTLPVPQAEATQVSGSDVSQLPTPMAEQSPPTYKQSMPESTANGDSRPPNQHPREYGDLLPSREITQSPPREVLQSPPADLNAMSNTSSRHASAAAFERPSAGLAAAAVTQTTKGAPKDDFDDAFDDLSEAKADETDAFGSSTRSDYEFNPNFDSPAPSHATMNDSSRHQTTSSFDSAFGTSGAQPFPVAAASTSSNQHQTSSSNHDWDELFSGLDSSTATTNGSRDPFEIVPGGMGSVGAGQIMDGPAPTFGGTSYTTATGSTQPEPFTTTSSFSPFGTSTSSQAARTESITSPTTASSSRQYTAPTSPPPSSRNAPTSPSISASASTSQYAPPSSPPPPHRSSSLRPGQLSRALSQGTEHDDPILKTLTGMGYDRTKALKALEKYDYNIDMVSPCPFVIRKLDYLVSESCVLIDCDCRLLIIWLRMLEW